MANPAERKWHGPKQPDSFYVRARTDQDPGNYYFASTDGDFVTWKPGSGALHLSPIRNKIRPFASKEDAEAFINSITGQHQFDYIAAEVATAALQKIFDSRHNSR